MKTFWERNASTRAQNKIKKLAKGLSLDFKALNILFNSIWDYDDELFGWVASSGGDNKIPDAEFEYGRAKGLLRPNEEITAQKLFGRIEALINGLEKEQVSNAFIKGIATQNPAYISVLGSYSYYLSIDDNSVDTYLSYKEKNKHLNPSQVVINYNKRVFDRLFRSGIMSHQDPVYAYVDLLDFSNTERISISETETAILVNTLKAIQNVPNETQPSELEKVTKSFLMGNMAYRQIVLRILGISDILNPSVNKRIRETYELDQELPNHFYKKEMGYPLAWWEGKYGLDDEAVLFWFSNLDVSET